METEEQINGSAGDGAQTDQAKANAAVTFTAEQQAHIDKLVGERLTRAQEKWKADLEAKGQTDAKAAEARRLKDEQRWQELATSQEAKAAEAEQKLAAAAEQLERANAVVEGLVEARKRDLPDAILKALDGRDIYDQLQLATAFAEAMPAQAGGPAQRTAATKPTPPAQGPKGLTDEERRKAAARTF
ncbi:MAG: hypothetical protein KJ046_17685 [Anaerolineae bacterium]|nr:hypothetical protein [Anaerolineae bacterium]